MKYGESFGDLLSERQDQEKILWNTIINQFRNVFKTKLFVIIR